MTAPILRVVDWDAIQQQLAFVNRHALEDLLAVYNTVSGFDAHRVRQYLLDAVPAIVETYGGAASELSLAWWDDLFDGIESPPPVAPAPPPSAQLVAQTRWATAPLFTGASPATRLASVIKQHIYGAQRGVVTASSQQADVRYARVARSNACNFCRVIASRGAVYGSAERARVVGATGMQNHYSDGSARGRREKQGRIRGIRKAGETYHDHCRCTVVPSASHLDLNLPAYYEKFEQEYDTAVSMLDRANGGKPGVYSMSAVTAMMRELGYAK